MNVHASGRNVARASLMVAAGIIRAEQACEHKAAFPTRNDARHAAKRTARKTGRQANTYKCPFCGLWHVSKVKHGELDE